MHKDDSEIAEVINILSKGKRNVTENDKQIQEMKNFLSKLTHPSEDKIEKSPLKNVTKHHDFGKNVKNNYLHYTMDTYNQENSKVD